MAGAMRVAHMDDKSVGSYRSTHTTRSSVLERAREYNKRLDEQKARRSKSVEPAESEANGSTVSGTPRSQSAGRLVSNFPSQQMKGNRPFTRDRAMASLQRDALSPINASPVSSNKSPGSNKSPASNTTSRSHDYHQQHANNDTSRGSPMSMEANQATPRSRVSGASAYSSHVSRPSPTTPRMSGEKVHTQRQDQQHQHQQRSNGSRHRHVNTDHNHDRHTPTNMESTRSNRSNTEHLHNPNSRNAPTPRVPAPINTRAPQTNNNANTPNGEENQEAVVTPELLVDALSGHEDGLLAIAERLMEHYDSGYDVMGEAIIDAFADVQKLFQHVVEAAHMEGAAFEASRKEEEIAELRKQAAAAGELNGNAEAAPAPSNGGTPARHDEFIDQDVKDILTEAIKQGTNYRNSNKFSECYQLYEQACQNASSLLPVDSDHRGRLQLSIARAESMSHERACAILRYAMDDVLRSGLRAGNTPLPDVSQRADVVLTRPKSRGATGVQSSEEALNSLVEEMREVMNAPVYNNTPLQSVAKRFLAALAENQKAQSKNEEKLEQNLAKLKGDFLLARAEWEERLNSTQETADVYKEKYQRLKDSVRNKGGSDRNLNVSTNLGTPSGSTYLDHARSALASQQQRAHGDDDDTYGGYASIRSSASRAGSHAGSLGSGLASHARDGVRSLVGSFSCAGGSQRSGGVVAHELQENRDAEIREMAFRHDSGMRDRDRRRGSDSRRNSGNHGSINMSYSDRSFESQQSAGPQPSRRTHTPHSVASGSTRSKSSRSFREYSRSPQRVDF